MNFRTKMRVGHVLRWNIVRSYRTQTLAEHLYRVWLVAGELCRQLNLSPVETRVICDAALLHDLPEVLIGDLPTPTKRAIEQRAGNPDIWKKLERDVSGHIPPDPGTLASHIVKIADCIEGWYFMHEEGIGEHAADTKLTLMKRARDVAVEASVIFPNHHLLEATDRIMVDLMKLPVEHAQ